MKMFRTLLLLASFTFLTFCKSRYYVDLEKIKFDDVKLKNIECSDSVKLSFTLKIPPKSVGKKGIAVMIPMIIDEPDTIKFKTIVLTGEGTEDDCMNISYKHETIRDYQSIGKGLFNKPYKNDITFRIVTTKKDEIHEPKIIQIAINSIQGF